MDSNLTVSGSIIGTLAMFRGRDVFVRPADLKDILASEGVGWVNVPDALDPIARAVRSSGTFRTSRITGRAVRVEVLEQSKGAVTFGLLFREVVRANEEVAWRQGDVVSYGPHGWTAPTTPEGQAFVTYASKWQSHLDYGWVRDRVFFAGFRRLGAFTVGSGGGMYYVMDQQSELQKLRSIARKCGSSDVDLITVGADADSQSAIAEAAIVSVTEQVESVVGQLAAWQEKAKGKKSTLERLYAELGDIRKHAAKLAGVLKFNTGAIDQAMQEAVAAVQAAMTESAPTVSADVAPVAPVEAAVLPGPASPTAEAAQVVAEAPTAPAPDAIPSPEELETWGKAKLVAAAVRLGLPVKGDDKKALTSLQLAESIAALRQERMTA